MRLLLSVCLLAISGIPAFSQFGSSGLGDETHLYAETKQVNQFFRRFNCEETKEGKRIYEGNPLFHNTEFRRQYLDILFDNESGTVPSQLKSEFISEVTYGPAPLYLDFHGGDWFAEVTATFIYLGQDRELTMFLVLQEEDTGSKWVLEQVWFEAYDQFFNGPDTIVTPPFLHPMSHELDFINLDKIFRNNSNIMPYTARSYNPDHLSLFLYDVKQGLLSFKSVRNMQLHFFQADGWYFKVSDFQRKGYNTGWLISELYRLQSSEAEAFKQQIQIGR